MTARGPALRGTPQVGSPRELVSSTHACGGQARAPGGRVRVVPRSVTGRRTAPGELPPAFEDPGHL